jgi:hypothetical protein
MRPTSTFRIAVVAAVSTAVAAFAAIGLPPGGGRPAASGYFSVQPDLRLCPAPTCGGFFVSMLNQARVSCPGRGRAEMCQVASIDWSKLALGPAATTELENAVLAGRGVVRGDLVAGRGSGSPLGQLVVREGWLAASARQPRGGFFSVVSNGVVCVTTPCFNLRKTLLNTTSRKSLSGLDLAPAGATEAARGEALHDVATSSILVSGRDRAVPDAGPAGKGVELVATQFYLRVGGPST